MPTAGGGSMPWQQSSQLHRIELEKVASVDKFEYGDLITYTLTITHVHDVSPDDQRHPDRYYPGWNHVCLCH